MNILVVIVHFWNPAGNGKHQSLRPDPLPRIHALCEQLLSLRRLSLNQSVLHMADRAAYRVNDDLRHSIDIKIVTDSQHHVLNLIDESFPMLS